MTQATDPSDEKQGDWQSSTEEQSSSIPAQEAIPLPPPPANEPTQLILSAMSQIATEFSNLNRTIESRISYDETKEKAFDRLYTELDELKKNYSYEQLRPFYIDLILLFDRIENIRQSEAGSGDSPVIPDFIATLADELLEILYRREIEIINNTSPVFDPSFQLALSIQPTTSADENNLVARVIRRGFRYRDRILRPEEVIVKKFRSAQASAEPISAVTSESHSL